MWIDVSCSVKAVDPASASLSQMLREASQMECWSHVDCDFKNNSKQLQARKRDLFVLPWATFLRPAPRRACHALTATLAGPPFGAGSRWDIVWLCLWTWWQEARISDSTNVKLMACIDRVFCILFFVFWSSLASWLSWLSYLWSWGQYQHLLDSFPRRVWHGWMWTWREYIAYMVAKCWKGTAWMLHRDIMQNENGYEHTHTHTSVEVHGSWLDLCWNYVHQIPN